MFGLGIWEIVIIVLVALIVLGPEKLPEVARQLGRGIKEIRRASHDLQSTIQEAVYEEEDRSIRSRFGPPPAPPQSEPSTTALTASASTPVSMPASMPVPAGQLAQPAPASSPGEEQPSHAEHGPALK